MADTVQIVSLKIMRRFCRLEKTSGKMYSLHHITNSKYTVRTEERHNKKMQWEIIFIYLKLILAYSETGREILLTTRNYYSDKTIGTINFLML
jgi:hypothetical protein